LARPWQYSSRTSEPPNVGIASAISIDRNKGSSKPKLPRRSAEWCSLDAADEKLARFAGKLSRQVGALVDKIERRLS
jgi:hypothetical protein